MFHPGMYVRMSVCAYIVYVIVYVQHVHMYVCVLHVYSISCTGGYVVNIGALVRICIFTPGLHTPG